jgi:hypothetical protein
MELVTIGDELVIKVDCITIVSKNCIDYTDLFKLTIIHCFSDFETYLCHIPANHLYKFQGQFKIDNKFANILLLDTKFIGEFAVIIHNDHIFRKIKGIQGNRCISCHTFISNVGSNYTCYSCRQNPFPSWGYKDD